MSENLSETVEVRIRAFQSAAIVVLTESGGPDYQYSDWSNALGIPRVSGARWGFRDGDSRVLPPPKDSIPHNPPTLALDTVLRMIPGVASVLGSRIPGIHRRAPRSIADPDYRSRHPPVVSRGSRDSCVGTGRVPPDSYSRRCRTTCSPTAWRSSSRPERCEACQCSTARLPQRPP